jgi:hypothetical protein
MAQGADARHYPESPDDARACVGPEHRDEFRQHFGPIMLLTGAYRFAC